MVRASRVAAFLAAMMFQSAAIAEKVVTYFYVDQQGTPLAATDASGNVIARFEKTPYGFAVWDVPEPMGLHGHVFDEESGLIYMQARFYDPQAGRLLGVDPISPFLGDAGGFNRFVFGLNNPMLYSDPSGAEPTDDPNNAPVLPTTTVIANRPPDITLIGGPLMPLMFVHERADSVRPVEIHAQSFDEVADCVRENSWDWGNLGPAGTDPSAARNIGSAAATGNAAGNLVAGPTGSGISRVTHATSWQHRVASSIGQAMQRVATGRSFGPLQARISTIGKAAGRFAVATTVWEGFYDVGTLSQCQAPRIR